MNKQRMKESEARRWEKERRDGEIERQRQRTEGRADLYS